MVLAPLSLVLMVMRSYMPSPLQVEETHQDYYIHPETTNDPVSTILQLFHVNTVRIKICQENSLETMTVSSPPTDDTKSEFQKALAASMSNG
jgi:hypothetical protein